MQPIYCFMSLICVSGWESHWGLNKMSANLQTTLSNVFKSWMKTVVLHWSSSHGPLARYVKLRVAHTPGMLGTFSPPSLNSDPDMHHGTCFTHVPWCMPGSLTSGFLWSRWRGKRSRHSRRMRNSQFYVSGKTPMAPIDINSALVQLKTWRQIGTKPLSGSMLNQFHVTMWNYGLRWMKWILIVEQ